MDKVKFRLVSNRALARDVFAMRLSGNTSAITRPGQFVAVAVDGLYLRRPISVCDWDENGLLLIYKAVGRGTRLLSELCPGAEPDLLTGLGNGYDVSRAGARPLLIGGGVGVPPLYALAKRLSAAGKQCTVLLGFNGREDVFGVDMFKELGLRVLVATADGSFGERGFVTDLLPLAGDYDYSFACGPEAMLRAVYDRAGCPGQYSFEERMGCGFGVCMGCSRETKNGSVRICRDGPVLDREEILWRTQA